MTRLGTSKDSTNTGDREGYLGKGQAIWGVNNKGWQAVSFLILSGRPNLDLSYSEIKGDATDKPYPSSSKYHNCQERTNFIVDPVKERNAHDRQLQFFHDAIDLPLFTSASFRPGKNYTRSQDLEKFLEFHHQGPITFLKVVSEPILARVYRLSRDLTDHHVLVVKVTTKHLGSITSWALYLYTNLLSFPG